MQLMTLNTPRNSISPNMTAHNFKRYAIYFLPEKGTPLAQFGRTWFGHDPETNESEIGRRCYGLGNETVKRITSDPARYCFHGTLKAPFRLAETKSEIALRSEVAEFAAQQKSFALHRLALAEMIGHLVLALPERDENLNRLARACVANLDRFRAPLIAEELRHRNVNLLTERQRALLEQWGYPYTFEEFRFHVTLTNALSSREIAQILPVLAPALKDVSLEPVEVKSICLMGDPGNGETFRLLERFPFSA